MERHDQPGEIVFLPRRPCDQPGEMGCLPHRPRARVITPAGAAREVRRRAQAVAGAGREGLVRLAAARARSSRESPPSDPRSIFVLRNNDIGDLLVVTPLFAALRSRFPGAAIAAGVGDWGRPVLSHNPHVSEVLPVNAPWFNKYSGRRGALRYLWRSPETRALAERHFEVGIDVLGSAWGALLLLEAGIPYRMGVHGYAGGHSAAQAVVEFDPALHVGRAALRFAELLGASDLPPCRPQIFLTAAERENGERSWRAVEPAGRRRPRLLVGPGGGLAAKCWPASSFAILVGALAQPDGRVGRLAQPVGPAVLVVGGPREQDLVSTVAAGSPAAGRLPAVPSLREVFALAAAADVVICNSSMLLHAAAAFERATVVLLGESFPSASRHQAQWGYPERCRSLGKEPGLKTGIASPDEALAAVKEEIGAFSALH
jgi:ADP-heptose:LPS heptosyltransferase